MAMREPASYKEMLKQGDEAFNAGHLEVCGELYENLSAQLDERRPSSGLHLMKAALAHRLAICYELQGSTSRAYGLFTAFGQEIAAAKSLNPSPELGSYAGELQRQSSRQRELLIRPGGIRGAQLSFVSLCEHNCPIISDDCGFTTEHECA